MTKIITELKEIASKATPGRWAKLIYTVYAETEEGSNFFDLPVASTDTESELSHEVCEANAVFIARFCPKTVLALLECLEMRGKEIADAIFYLNSTGIMNDIENAYDPEYQMLEGFKKTQAEVAAKMEGLIG